MKARFLFTRRMCPFCRQMIRVINKLNTNLPISKQIKILDCWEWEEFGLRNIPLMNKLEKDGLKEGFPFLYLDGTIVEPAPTQEQMNIFLKTYLKEDFLY